MLLGVLESLFYTGIDMVLLDTDVLLVPPAMPLYVGFSPVAWQY